MATCLVTGATGFLGGHLVERLVARGDSVRCQVRAQSDTSRIKDLDVELHVADVIGERDLDGLVADVNVVYHVAGVTHSFDHDLQMRVNRDGVAKMLEACARASQPPKFLLISSVAAAGPVARDELRREADPPAPVSHYGQTKLAGELVAHEWADRVPVSIVRPGVVFGPYDTGMLPIFRSISRSGIHFVPTLRAPPISLIHAADLAELLVLCAESGKTLAAEQRQGGSNQGCYFACAPETPDYAELGTMIAHAIGREKVFRWHMPGFMPWVVAGANELIGRLRRSSSPLRIDKIREARAASWACSCERAQAEFGFAPAKTLAEQLADTARWYRDAGWLK